MSRRSPEVGFGIGEAVGFQFDRFALKILADENEVAIVAPILSKS